MIFTQNLLNPTKNGYLLAKVPSSHANTISHLPFTSNKQLQSRPNYLTRHLLSKSSSIRASLISNFNPFSNLSSQTGDAVKVKATVTVKTILGGIFDNVGLTRPLDDLTRLLNGTFALELVSSELDPKTGAEKETIKAYAQKFSPKVDEIKYEAKFTIPAGFGEIGAILVENQLHKEMYIDQILIEGLPNGTLTLACESFVHSKYDNPIKRVFFTNKSYKILEGLDKGRDRDLIGSMIMIHIMILVNQTKAVILQDLFLGARNTLIQGVAGPDALLLKRTHCQNQEVSVCMCQGTRHSLQLRDRHSWIRDEEFSRQRLAGCNPLAIKLLTEWPITSKLDPQIYGSPDSLITAQLIEKQLGNVITVKEALEQKRLFVLDYHDVYLPYVSKVRELEGTTFYGSRAVFFLTEKGVLTPVAIELTRPPANGKPQWKQVFAPSVDPTEDWLWRLAKAHVCSHDSAYHQLVSHWLRTHCCVEPYIIAANRQLSAMHPIYRLLKPHFRYTMEINALARQSLINANGIIESTFAPGKYAIELSSFAYDKVWRFDQEALPADLIARGMAVEDPTAKHGLKLTIEDYPYANDGLALWDAIKQWVSDCVSYYYPEASKVEGDEELQAWWTEVRTQGHADKKDEPWWPVLKTQEDLIQVVTTIIWVGAGHHAAVNFGQYAYGGYFPNHPSTARIPMPTEEPSEVEFKEFLKNPEATLLECLPTRLQAIKVMLILNVLSSHSPEEEYIGDKLEPYWEDEPVIKAAFEKFNTKLKELEASFDSKNTDLNLRNRSGAGIVPYQLLKPYSPSGVTGKGHHTLIQALMARGPLTEADFLKIFADVTKNPGASSRDLYNFLLKINKELSYVQMEMRGCRDQNDGVVCFGLVNTVSDEHSKLGTCYSVPQLALFKGVVEAIALEATGSGCISTFDVLNIRLETQTGMGSQSQDGLSEVPPALRNFSMSQKEKTIDELVRDKWLFRASNGDIALGVRSYLDLRSWLHGLGIPSCDAKLCPSEGCTFRIHHYCLRKKIAQSRGKIVCPNCNIQWECQVPKTEVTEEEDAPDVPMQSQPPLGSRRKRLRVDRNLDTETESRGSHDSQAISDLKRMLRQHQKKILIDGTRRYVKTGSEKATVKPYLQYFSPAIGLEQKFVAKFNVPAGFREVGAVLVQNPLPAQEMYVKEIALEGFASGPVKISCESIVHPKQNKRVFFTNKSYLPSETPNGLKRLRDQELENLRGNGQGERRVFERIYDYDTYNDLGDPDKSKGLARPVLGGAQHPYPRHASSESRSSNVYVPRDEAFSAVKQITFGINILSAVLQTVLPGLEAVLDDPKKGFPNFPDIDSLYKQGLQLPSSLLGILKSILPGIVKTIRQGADEETDFRGSGMKSFLAKLLPEWPLTSKLDPQIYGSPESLITAEVVEKQIGNVITVDERLFMLDYHDIFLPYVNKVREQGAGTTLYGSRTLFFLTEEGVLKPVAIELTRPPAADGKPQWKQVFTPSVDPTSDWLWRLAKTHVSAHDSAHHQLLSHWLRTHASIEPYIIAANRQLSAMHPIYRLLKPHFRYTMEINALARKSLINAGGIIESTFGAGKYSMELSSYAYDKLWRFDQEALPADLVARGMAVKDPTAKYGLKLTIEDYPYANDGLPLWDAIKQWVGEYVKHYYPEAGKVESDEELQAWWTEVRTQGHADKKDEPWWPVLKAQDDLIQVLTTIIWVGSGHHAAVNFGQYAYGGYFPNHPTIARTTIPTEEEPNPEAKYKEFLNNPEATLLESLPARLQALKVMLILDVLSTHSPDEEYIGDKLEPYWKDEPVVKAAFERFNARLKELEGSVDSSNSDLDLRNRSGAGIVPYQLLKPFSPPGLTGKGVPNSISI
ncbi:hypothetical protein Tsubulata_012964 [Turnera subulata]|uniref:Lipoxygenase n=1 Tax=Turnera subulata TaxID=218843 RepID=A0A9Q0FNL7_9ROSI|nr:hypothetical protein Tsubulata_012964 [Turnera subulata]